MTSYNSDSSLQLSGNALKKMGVDSDSFLSLQNDSSAWSFDPTDSESLEVLITDSSGNQIGQKNFDQPFILIGRAQSCDLRLDDESVSFRHAYLQRMYGRVMCVDLASRSGTYWDREELPYGWFDEQHPIRIGPYELRLGASIFEEEPVAPEFDPKSFFRTFSNQAVLPNVSLQHLARSGPGETWTINRPITLVGSCSRCRLKLSHKSVSKVHCSLLLMPDGLWVVDLLGKDGTFVNGEPVKYLRIADGSTLKVGRFTFRVTYHSSSQRQMPQIASQAGSTPTPTHGVSEEFVLQLMNQITNMQQQFLMQSQQQTEMMMQFFGSIHTNQHNLLREEMARLHEINREMRDLRQHLENPPSQPDSIAPRLPDPSQTTLESESQTENKTEETPREVDRLNEQFEQLRHQMMQHKEAYHKEMESKQAEEKLVADANWKLQKAADLDRSAIDFVHPEEVLDKKKSDVTPIIEEPIRVSEQAAPLEIEPPIEAPEAETDPVPEQDHHAWVLDRMHKLEHERKGLFQKMLQSLFSSNG